MDIFNNERTAGPLPSCYSQLMEEERSFVDRLTVSLFVNKLMTGGELITDTLEKLKPTERCAVLGNSNKRAMNKDEHKLIIGKESYIKNNN